jgi:hypothetical protein
MGITDHNMTPIQLVVHTTGVMPHHKNSKNTNNAMDPEIHAHLKKRNELIMSHPSSSPLSQMKI